MTKNDDNKTNTIIYKDHGRWRTLVTGFKLVDRETDMYECYNQAD